MRLKSKVILVTASTRGIGLACVKACAKEGAIVYMAARNPERAQEIADELNTEGGNVKCVFNDATKPETFTTMVEDVVRNAGRIDVLVNNAGISQKKTVADMTVEEMKRIFEINMFGLFRCSKAVMGIMQQQKYGRIVNLSSAAGKRGGGFLGGAHYSASKAAVLGFSKCMAREVAADGVTVNCVAPGVILTDMCANVDPEVLAEMAEESPVGRNGTAADVAKAMAYLADAEFITGHVLSVNGGYVI